MWTFKIKTIYSCKYKCFIDGYILSKRSGNMVAWMPGSRNQRGYQRPVF